MTSQQITRLLDIFGEKAVQDFCRCSAYIYRIEGDTDKAEWYEEQLHKLKSNKITLNE